AQTNIAQHFISPTIKYRTWMSLDVLDLHALNADQTMHIAMQTSRLKKTPRRLKPVQVDGKNYQLVYSRRVVNLLDEKGQSVAATSKDRRQVHIGDQVYTRQRGRSLHAWEYTDKEGDLVVSGRYNNQRLLLTNHTKEDQELLMIICLEEVIYQYQFRIATLCYSDFNL
ncbi:MAG: hypothetical protein AAFO94_11235, partial [Bacteroidota bacterium]